METEALLRHYEAQISQEMLDIQAEIAILNHRHQELLEKRVELLEEIGKFVIARTEQ